MSFRTSGVIDSNNRGHAERHFMNLLLPEFSIKKTETMLAKHIIFFLLMCKQDEHQNGITDRTFDQKYYINKNAVILKL